MLRYREATTFPSLALSPITPQVDQGTRQVLRVVNQPWHGGFRLNNSEVYAFTVVYFHLIKLASYNRGLVSSDQELATSEQ